MSKLDAFFIKLKENPVVYLSKNNWNAVESLKLCIFKFHWLKFSKVERCWKKTVNLGKTELLHLIKKRIWNLYILKTKVWNIAPSPPWSEKSRRVRFGLENLSLFTSVVRKSFMDALSPIWTGKSRCGSRKLRRGSNVWFVLNFATHRRLMSRPSRLKIAAQLCNLDLNSDAARPTLNSTIVIHETPEGLCQCVPLSWLMFYWHCLPESKYSIFVLTFTTKNRYVLTFSVKLWYVSFFSTNFCYVSTFFGPKQKSFRLCSTLFDSDQICSDFLDQNSNVSTDILKNFSCLTPRRYVPIFSTKRGSFDSLDLLDKQKTFSLPCWLWLLQK